MYHYSITQVHLNYPVAFPLPSLASDENFRYRFLCIRNRFSRIHRGAFLCPLLSSPSYGREKENSLSRSPKGWGVAGVPRAGLNKVISTGLHNVAGTGLLQNMPAKSLQGTKQLTRVIFNNGQPQGLLLSYPG